MSLLSNAIAFFNPIGFCQPIERGWLSPSSRKNQLRVVNTSFGVTFASISYSLHPVSRHNQVQQFCWLLRMVYFSPATGIPASSLPFGKVFLLAGKMTSIFLNSSNSLVPNCGKNNIAALRLYELQLYAAATDATFQRRSLRRTSP